jgi:Putative beta-barrel porin-2, OmpL-like. bbp2
VHKNVAPFLIAFSLFPLIAIAEEPAKSPPPPKWYDTFEIHGLVDAYYSANVTQKQTEPNLLRVFDSANGFQLAYGKIVAQAAPAPIGFRVDIGFGPVSAFTTFDHLQQGYLSVKLPGDIIVDGGRFVTNAGAEVIEAKDNWIYSRSLLFDFAIPFTHTGLRATIPIPGIQGLSLMAGLFNGFDQPAGVPGSGVSNKVGSTKMGHLALLYSGPSNTTVTLNGYYGYTDATQSDTKTLLDGVVGRSFGDLSLNVNVDYGRQSGNQYWGFAGMARYSFFADTFRVSGRGEYFDDSDGAAGITDPAGARLLNKYWEGTLSLSVPAGSNAEFRVEGRYDRSVDVNLFKGGTEQGQGTVQVAALAWF